MNHFSSEDFLYLGLDLAGFKHQRNRGSLFMKMRRYKSEYGSSPRVHAAIFKDLKLKAADGPGQGIPQEAKPAHFLWAMNWIKNYPNLVQMAGKYGKVEATVSKWTWYYMEKINELFDLKIKWRWHANNNDPDEIFIVSVDGVHCRINEPGGFDPQYYSHKSRKAAYNYEVAVDIFEPKIVHVCGPTFGQNDGTVSQRPDGIQSKVPPGKKVIADGIYTRKYGDCFSIPNRNDPDDLAKFKDRARARQETVNARLKIFNILAGVFHHRKEHHGLVFRAVCIIVQYEMDLGEPIFDV